MLNYRSSRPEVFLGKVILKICRKFTCDFNKVAKKSNFIEIAFRLGCSPIDLLHMFRTPFPRNNSGWLLLELSEFTEIFMSLLDKHVPKNKNIFEQIMLTL